MFCFSNQLFNQPSNQSPIKTFIRAFTGCIITLIVSNALSISVYAQGNISENVQVNAHIQAPQIYGGEEASEDAYPWMVGLVSARAGSPLFRHFCGGVLIAPEWVLTAAHCTYQGQLERSPESFNVLVETTRLASDKGEEITVSQIIRHPQYHRKTANLDVALLQLSKPVQMPFISLGDASVLTEESKTQTMILGWGRTETKTHSEHLLQTQVPLVDAETCNAAFTRFDIQITTNMLCAGYVEGGRDACSGDSGGPLIAPAETDAEGQVAEWTLVGIVSWGIGCAEADLYGVYTNITTTADWITETMALENVVNAKAVIDEEVPVSAKTLNLTPVIFLPVVHN